MNRIDKNAVALEIQNQYKIIDDRWLRLHYHALVGLVVFSFFFEIIIAISMYLGDSNSIPINAYALKYLVAPMIGNISLILCAFVIMNFTHFTQAVKIYCISLISVGICLVFYVVHGVFDSLYIIFFIPILFTVIYNDFLLTTITAILSFSMRAISDFFIAWDSSKSHPLESNLSLTDFIVSMFVLLILYFISMLVIQFEKEKNKARIEKEIDYRETKEKLKIDDLTNIYNRTGLRDAFQDVLEDISGNAYTLALLDIDNFKLFNDTFGHQYGDQYLRNFADILKQNCPQSSRQFRYGSDEFCILFVNFEIDEIIGVCKNIQEDMKPKFIGELSTEPCTVSIGIAAYEKGMSPSQLFRKSDVALYRSKSKKNSISVFGSTDEL